MRRKYNVAALLLASVLILLGMTELPLLYTWLFDAAEIVEGQEPLMEPMETAPRDFIRTLQEPLWQEKQPLSREAVGAFLADGREYLDSGIYKRLFETAGLAYEEVAWDGLSTINGTDDCRIEVERAQGDGRIYAVFHRTMPVLLYYRSSLIPTAQDMEDAVTRLEGHVDTGGASLISYLQKIDQIYEGSEEYQAQLVHLYLSVFRDAAVQEITQAPDLQLCCSSGTWQVYSDDTEAVLACLMGRSCLILYYDAAEQDFCGFRMEFHSE